MPVPRDREDLCEEHPRGDLGQIAAAVAFLLVWGLDSFLLKLTTFPAAHVPLYVRLPAAALLLVGAGVIAASGHRVIFGEVRRPPQVVRTGAFSYTRHPIYLSTILAYLGLAVSTLSVASFAVWVAVCVFYGRISAYEEDRLTDRFGEAYTEYMNQVPKWLPRPAGFGKN